MRSLRVSVGETRLLITDLTPRPRWVEQISGACAGLNVGGACADSRAEFKEAFSLFDKGTLYAVPHALGR
jgi:hypothetical protein